MKRIYSVSNTKRLARIIVANDEEEAAQIAKQFGFIKQKATGIIDTTNYWPQYSKKAIKEVLSGISGWASIKTGPDGYMWCVMNTNKQIVNYKYYTRR